ncbi:GumC domain-containing protein [Desulfogranum japonicum]|uniref:hypothetical protein n=1 Tax=Desulfogranum japonicum TaxID=231447 RepID=UPI00041D2DB3|nr:hypothetical protein [Desulfogranum japonicum]
MANAASKFVYTIQAQYEGTSAFKSFSADLNDLKNVQAFTSLNASLEKNKTALAAAEQEALALAAALSQSKDPKLAASIDKTSARLENLTEKSGLQVQALSILERELTTATQKYTDLGAAYQKDPTAALAAQYKKAGDAVDALTLRIDKKRLAMDKERATIQAVETKLNGLKSAYDDSSDPAIAAQYKAQANAVQKLADQVGRQETALGELSAKLKDAKIDTGNLTAEEKKLEAAAKSQAKVLAAQNALGVRSFADIEVEVKGLEQAYKDLAESGTRSQRELAAYHERMKSQIADLREGTNGWTAQIEKVKSSWFAFAGAIGTGVGIGAMAKQIGDAQRELESFAKIAGLAPNELQAYGTAVKSVGISVEGFADMNKDLKDKVGDFIATGGGEFADFFENVASQVGLTAEELAKLSGPDAFVAVQKAMDETGVSAEQQIFYMEALANDASRLIPLLKDEGAALKKKAAAAAELNDSISALDRENVENVNESIDRMGLAFFTLSTEIISTLAPAILTVTDGLTKLMDAASNMSAPMKMIISGVGAAAVAFATWRLGIAPIFSALQLVGVNAVSLTGTLGKLTTGLQGATFAVKGLQRAFLLLAAWEVGKMIGNWLNQFDIVKKAATAMVETFVVGALRIKQAWKWITGGDTDAVQKEIDDTKKIFSEMYADIDSGAKQTGSKHVAVQQKTAQAVANVSKEIAKQQQQIIDGEAAIVEARKKTIKELNEEIPDYAKDDYDNVFGYRQDDPDTKEDESKKELSLEEKYGWTKEDIKKFQNAFDQAAGDALAERIESAMEKVDAGNIKGIQEMQAAMQNIAGQHEVTQVTVNDSNRKADKVVELKFEGGSVTGSESDVEALLNQLEAAGMRA